ncbi:MAG: hypothetical protein AABX47_10215 [Nanoarchaeota archaeon]
MPQIISKYTLKLLVTDGSRTTKNTASFRINPMIIVSLYISTQFGLSISLVSQNYDAVGIMKRPEIWPCRDEDNRWETIL